MNFIFIILISLAGALKPLHLQEVHYQDSKATTSCQILKHRAKERQKVIREHLHLNKSSTTDQLSHIIKLNHLMINQIFLEPEIWQDESVLVTATFDVDDNLTETIDQQGLDEIVFSIDGPGIRWQAKSYNFPKAMSWQLNRDQRQLTASYMIYKGSLCFETQDLTLSWQTEL